MAKVGIIGGSGLYQLDGIKDVQHLDIFSTPYGPPSDQIMAGTLDGVEVIFLARHGRGHHIPPSDINYRANIFEMKRLGVEAIVSVSACGSLREDMKPMDFVVPDQFVDRTNKARESSFFTRGLVAHVSLANPVAPELTEILIASCKEIGVTVHPKGTYINMEGPQFSTIAESNLYRKWGMDIIGMTNMVEAKLAREAEISYASLCAVTDYDCRHPDHDSVTVDMIIQNLQKNVQKAKDILKIAIPQIGRIKKFSAADALRNSIITQKDYAAKHKMDELKIFIQKYF